MAILRDIGKAVSDVLRPDGKPISLETFLPGLSTGTARSITQAVTGNSATIDVNKIDLLEEDPNSTPAIKTFGYEKVIGGPPYENVLERFASYTSIWTLCCLTPNQFNDPRTYRGKPGALKNIVLSSAGRYDEQRVKTLNGSPEYFIDNITMASKMVGEDAGWTNVTEFNFDVYEPYSMGLFYQSLQAAAIDAGYPQYLGDTPFLLKLEFVGYDDQGRMFTSRESLAKYFTILITDSEMRVDEGGSRYKVKGKPFHHQGYSDGNNKFPADINISGTSVVEVLSSGKNSLMNTLNKAQFDLVDKNQADRPDLYEIVFPIDWQDRVGLEGGINTETLRAIVDLAAGKQIKVGGNVDFDLVEYGQGPIGYASMGFTAASGGNYLYKDAVDVVDPKTGRILRDGMTIDPKKRSFSFGANTHITNIIKFIVLASEYCAKSLKPNAIDPKTGLVNWFRVDVQIDLLEYDKKRNQRAKKYIYRVVPFKVSAEYMKNPSSVTPTQGREKVCAKRYDYLYSGQNNDILKFDLQFNGMFRTGQLPRPASQHASIQNTDVNAATNEKRENAEVNSGQAPEAAASPTGTPATSPDYKIKTGTFSGEKTVEQIISDVFQRNFEAASKDMIGVKMDILGDPYYLADAGLCSKYLGEYGPNEQIDADGSMNWQGTEIFCYITFRNPIEPNLGTKGKGGLFNFPKGEWVSPYSGLFRVLNVEHKWSGGTFQQTLEMNRVTNQNFDFKGRAQIERQSQNLYEIKEAPPQTGPVDTASYGGDEGE